MERLPTHELAIIHEHCRTAGNLAKAAAAKAILDRREAEGTKKLRSWRRGPCPVCGCRLTERRYKLKGGMQIGQMYCCGCEKYGKEEAA